MVPQRGEILALDQSAVGLKRVVTKVPRSVSRRRARTVGSSSGRPASTPAYNSAFTAGGVHWLLSEAIGMIPALAEAPIVEIWTGFRPNSLDGVPSIGPGAG